MSRDEAFEPKLGRIRDRAGARAPSALNHVKAAVARAGGFGAAGKPSARSVFGRGRAAALLARHAPTRRTVVVKARVVRPGTRSTLAAHLAYLSRDGVDRRGAPGRLFDRAGDGADAKAFTARTTDDRHHFRFIVSPEDADRLADLKRFARDLMTTMEGDLGTRLDWVGVDHWNTPHPHLHLIVRGVEARGADLVIARDYIAHGLRARAEALVERELGPRLEPEIRRGFLRDAQADGWTRLDRLLAAEARRADGVVDLRPSGPPHPAPSPVRLARLRKLEALGLARPDGVGRWRLSPDAELTLKALARRGDIIARLHDAMATSGRAPDPIAWSEAAADVVVGRVAARGLDDELRGTGYVVIEGVDGRLHHRTVPDATAPDPRLGAVVEARPPAQPGLRHPRMRIRSDLELSRQETAEGATWLDRLRVDPHPPTLGGGFGAHVAAAMERRGDWLIAQGLARRGADGLVPIPNLIGTLAAREIEAAAARLETDTGLVHRRDRPSSDAVYRRRLDLASGRFALVDDGLSFSLVPWRPAMEHRLGQAVGDLRRPADGAPTLDPGRRRGPAL
ncbi:MAG: DUF3363 domain-containing protein [Brevundimonas sp.]|uniref:DUF3363 domain-containing protein n=1 Tax=Brevundimonas sp. TaxID=1871086 RepID=UPI00258BCFF1|nr:DUF3363 domain-containing protein [Brevundimonas sp.]MCV0413803.1 DUF3363 domain-containing protein [Brevundimonas sp.]